MSIIETYKEIIRNLENTIKSQDSLLDLYRKIGLDDNANKEIKRLNIIISSLESTILNIKHYVNTYKPAIPDEPTSREAPLCPHGNVCNASALGGCPCPSRHPHR